MRTQIHENSDSKQRSGATERLDQYNYRDRELAKIDKFSQANGLVFECPSSSAVGAPSLGYKIKESNAEGVLCNKVGQLCRVLAIDCLINPHLRFAAVWATTKKLSEFREAFGVRKASCAFRHNGLLINVLLAFL